MGRDVAEWLGTYLGENGLTMYYISPNSKIRRLLEGGVCGDVYNDGDEVSNNNISLLPSMIHPLSDKRHSKINYSYEVVSFSFQTCFAAAPAIQLVSEASLLLLNTRTDDYIAMECFRPNIRT